MHSHPTSTSPHRANARPRSSSGRTTWRYRREQNGSLTLYPLSPEPEPDELLTLEVGDFLVEAIKPTFPGTIAIATGHRSYHTFTKADELSTEQIDMEWASRDEDVSDAATPP